MKRKVLWLGLSCLLVASLVLASCAKEEVVTPGEQEEEEEVVTPTAGEPQYGGTLRMHTMYSTDPPSWDLMVGKHVTASQNSPYMEELVVGDVIGKGPRGTNQYSFGILGSIPEDVLTGNLAQSWEWVDTSTLVFHIRPGIMWAANPYIGFQSREYTAYDAEWCLNRYKESIWGPQYLAWVDSFEATDKYTLVVHTNCYTVAWVQDILTLGLQYPSEVVEAGIENWRNHVGTGPFIMIDYVAGSYTAYERNPNYWGKVTINGKEYQLPFVDKLFNPIIPDSATQMAALKTGKVDVDLAVVATYKDTLRTVCPQLIVTKHLHNCAWIVVFSDNPPFNDINVRRAMMIGTDMKAVAQAVWGEGVQQVFPFTPLSSPAIYTQIEDLPPETKALFEYDPVKAKEMLADAGYPNGFDTELVFRADRTQFQEREMAENLASRWAAIGIRTTLRGLDGSPFISLVQYERRFPAMALRPCGNTNPQDGLTLMMNNPSLTNLNSDESFKTKATSALSMLDVTERNAAYKELGIYIINNVNPWGVSSPYELGCYWPWVKNYYGELEAGNHYQTTLWANIWVDQNLKAEMGYR